MTIDPKALYNAYNAGGDPARRGLSWDGRPCPAWADLPENVRAKWQALADLANRKTPDTVFHTTHTHLSWLDRLRVLLGGEVHIRSAIPTEDACNVLPGATAEAWVDPVFLRRERSTLSSGVSP